jgi:hypothetical protein
MEVRLPLIFSFGKTRFFPLDDLKSGGLPRFQDCHIGQLHSRFFEGHPMASGVDGIGMNQTIHEARLGSR